MLEQVLKYHMLEACWRVELLLLQLKQRPGSAKVLQATYLGSFCLKSSVCQSIHGSIVWWSEDTNCLAPCPCLVSGSHLLSAEVYILSVFLLPILVHNYCLLKFTCWLPFCCDLCLISKSHLMPVQICTLCPSAANPWLVAYILQQKEDLNKIPGMDR